jgi:hypothetical protein
VARRRRSEAGGPVVGRIRIGSPKPRRIWPVRSPRTRPSWTAMSRSWRQIAAQWDARRSRWSSQPECCEPGALFKPRSMPRTKPPLPAGPGDAAVKHHKPKHLPNVVVNTTDPQSRIMPTRKGAADATARQAMSHRLRTEEGKALYKRRGATVEPAIGNLKKILDRFSRRGLNAALGELQLAATACNLLKIYRPAAA